MQSKKIKRTTEAPLLVQNTQVCSAAFSIPATFNKNKSLFIWKKFS